MDTVTLKYTDGATYARTYYVLSARGLDDPDQWRLEPPVQLVCSDHSIVESYIGFRRIATITLGVLQSHADRTFLSSFIRANTREIAYGSSSNLFSLYDKDTYSDTWLNNLSNARFFELKLIENSIRQVWPDRVITDNMIGYVKSKVEISQDETNPETFTTAVGKLATDDTGAAIPSISLTTYAPVIVVMEKQSALIVRPDAITQSGSNISFKMGYSLAGNPYSDGKYYADIAILLQTR